MQHRTKSELLNALHIAEEKAAQQREFAKSPHLPTESHEKLATLWDERAQRIRNAINLEYDPSNPFSNLEVDAEKEAAYKSVLSVSNIMCVYSDMAQWEHRIFPTWIDHPEAVYITLDDDLPGGAVLYKVVAKKNGEQYTLFAAGEYEEAKSFIDEFAMKRGDFDYYKLQI